MKFIYPMSFYLMVALFALPAAAQPAPGAGQGKGPGFRINQGNTPGWTMMNEKERAEHREKMMSLNSYDECTAYMNEHHKLMQERAKEKGRPLPSVKTNACDRMKARGMLK